jgi:hypothetical protein
VARKYVFTRFKTLKDLSVVAVEGVINKLKQEDELHIYDAYREDLQTQEEFTSLK